MKSKSLILMIVSLGFGLIAAIGISQVMGKGGGDVAEIEMGPVVVALAELKHGEELNEENCKIENWPADIIPENACRNLEELKGMAIRNRLSKSLPVMRPDILKASEIGVVKIPKGFKVVAIKVGADDTMHGLLQPGHRVDVIGVVKVKDENGSQGKTISETFLRNVEVFSVNDKTRIRSAGEGGSSASSTVVGVLLKEQQAEQLVWIQKVARLKLVLRGDEDSDEEGGHLDQEKFDSIFGIVNNDLQNAGTKTLYSDDDDSHEVRVYQGNSYETVKFIGGDRVGTDVTELQAGGGSSTKSDSNDSSDFEGGLEEDQYPGE